MSFYLEMIDSNEGIKSYEDVKNRERIEYIGYEIQDKDLNKRKKHYFIFDTLSTLSLEDIHKNGSKLEIVIKPTDLKI